MDSSISYKEMVRYNTAYKTYGSAYVVSKWAIRSFVIALGFVIPVVLPIPFMAYIASRIKKNFIVRY